MDKRYLQIFQWDVFMMMQQRDGKYTSIMKEGDIEYVCLRKMRKKRLKRYAKEGMRLLENGQSEIANYIKTRHGERMS